jgi:hypothetical protein
LKRKLLTGTAVLLVTGFALSTHINILKAGTNSTGGIRKMKNKKGYISIIIAAVVIVILIGLLVTMIGVHIETIRNGTHTGYVTAIEENGIWFKTTSVYFKTDVQSSQEDRYCLIDKSLIPTLREKEASKEQITITFNSYLASGWNNCKIDDIAIINGIN